MPGEALHVRGSDLLGRLAPLVVDRAPDRAVEQAVGLD